MKLYANVQSERASKGQGGNKFVRTDYYIGDAKSPERVACVILTQEDGRVLMEATIIDTGQKFAAEFKTKMPGYYEFDCPHCGREKTWTGERCSSDDCPSRETKGEKEKGERCKHGVVSDHHSHCAICLN